MLKRFLKFSTLRFFLILVLVLGVGLRFTNLGQMVYWYDEGFTSLRIAGYTEAEAVTELRNAGITTIAAIQRFQTVSPDARVEQTVRSLALEDPQHPPLFYVIGNLWARAFGSDISVIRGLSAIATMLSFPAMFWLCRELFVETGVFPNTLVCWVGVGVLAVSPMHLIYAQEARQYGLWISLILLSHAALLYALRRRTVIGWLGYAIALAANFYTFLLTALLAIAHAGYVFGVGHRSNPPGQRRSFSIAMLGALVLALPWFIVTFVQLQQIRTVTGWTNNPRPLFNLLRDWLKTFSQLVFDTEIRLLDLVVQLGALVLMGYALVHLIRHTPRQVWWFVVAPIAVTGVLLMLPDVILGGTRAIARYMLPHLLSLQVAIAYLLTWGLQFSQPRQRQRWLLVLGAVLAAGMFSCGIILQSPRWWNKTHNGEIPEVAQVIQQSTRPLVLSDAELGDLFSLSHALQPEVPVWAYPRCYTCQLPAPVNPIFPDIPESDRELFFYHPRTNKAWQEQFQIRFNNDPHYQPEALLQAGTVPFLWRLVPTEKSMSSTE